MSDRVTVFRTLQVLALAREGCQKVFLKLYKATSVQEETLAKQNMSHGHNNKQPEPH